MIRVYKDYFIDVDQYEYTAKKDLHTTYKSGRPISDIVGHCGSLRNAVRCILENEARTTLASGNYELNEAINELSAINDRLEKLLATIPGVGGKKE